MKVFLELATPSDLNWLCKSRWGYAPGRRCCRKKTLSTYYCQSRDGAEPVMTFLIMAPSFQSSSASVRTDNEPTTRWPYVHALLAHWPSARVYIVLVAATKLVPKTSIQRYKPWMRTDCAVCCHLSESHHSVWYSPRARTKVRPRLQAARPAAVKKSL